MPVQPLPISPATLSFVTSTSATRLLHILFSLTRCALPSLHLVEADPSYDCLPLYHHAGRAHACCTTGVQQVWLSEWIKGTNPRLPTCQVSWYLVFTLNPPEWWCWNSFTSCLCHSWLRIWLRLSLPVDLIIKSHRERQSPSWRKDARWGNQVEWSASLRKSWS